MDDRLSQAGSGPERSSALLTRFGLVRKILDWLTTVFLLSDEQQEQAGVDLRRRYGR